MNFSELLANINGQDENHTIYVCSAGPIRPESKVSVAENPDDGSVPFDGMRELMDVWHARDTFNGCRSLLASTGSTNDHAACVQRFLLFIENDA